jgi:mono/diheme cytochrome c family protein
MKVAAMPAPVPAAAQYIVAELKIKQRPDFCLHRIPLKNNIIIAVVITNVMQVPAEIRDADPKGMGDHKMRAFLGGIVLCLCAIVLIAAAFIWSGIYDVAADVPHWRVTFWILEHAHDRSIDFHSRGIQPPSLKDKQLILQAAPHFQDACRRCHGAPGVDRNDFAQGLYPDPPPLSVDDVQNGLNDAQMFWVVKNGLKMTGMPAFKKIHSDDQLWAIVAFVRDLPNIYPQNYSDMLNAARKGAEKGNRGQP